MIPAGYLFKRIAAKPQWLAIDVVLDIYSLSGCISEDAAAYDPGSGKQNRIWLYDSPAAIEIIARDRGIDLSGSRLFYYELYECEFDDEMAEWKALPVETSFSGNVEIPVEKQLEGFDVVTVGASSMPEHSPLSCNSLATSISTNRHCLISTLDEARDALDGGCFENCEPGPYRIFAVYSMSGGA